MTMDSKQHEQDYLYSCLLIDRLAAIIREVDGSNSLGAGALAEAILKHPDFSKIGDREKLHRALDALHIACECANVPEVYEWYRSDPFATLARDRAINLLTELNREAFERKAKLGDDLAIRLALKCFLWPPLFPDPHGGDPLFAGVVTSRLAVHLPRR